MNLGYCFAVAGLFMFIIFIISAISANDQCSTTILSLNLTTSTPRESSFVPAGIPIVESVHTPLKVWSVNP